VNAAQPRPPVRLRETAHTRQFLTPQRRISHIADCLAERSEFELPVPVSRLSYDSLSGSSAKRATGKPGLALNSSSAFR